MPVSKRRTATGHTGLDMAIQITSMSATLSQLIPIPALSIATSTVLAIIDIVAPCDGAHDVAHCVNEQGMGARVLAQHPLRQRAGCAQDPLDIEYSSARERR